MGKDNGPQLRGVSGAVEEVDAVGAEQAAAGFGQSVVPQLFQPRGGLVPALIPEQAHHLPEGTHGSCGRLRAHCWNGFADHRAEQGLIGATVDEEPRQRFHRIEQDEPPGDGRIDRCP